MVSWNSIYATLLLLLPKSIASVVDTTGTIPILGADGGVYPRLEIRDLQKNSDQFFLFIRAFQQMQDLDTTDPLSYWQIAGIHGRPYVPWDGVPQCAGCYLTGYCAHAMTLFPTWHRPYLSLIEQALQTHARGIADTFDGDLQQRYQQAATALRLPYWDWAKDRAPGDDVFPAVVSNAMVQIIDAAGMSITIPNPLSSFKLNSDMASQIQQRVTQSWRRPNVVAVMNQNQASLQESIYRLFSRSVPYNNFSTINTFGTNYEDLESIHGEPHVLLGGFMPSPPISAFDPAFWLHHSMVDRIIALWQRLYPDAWLVDSIGSGDTFTIRHGTHVSGTTPLTPFHIDGNGTFWTSDLARDIERLGYTYPELADGTSQASVRIAINRLYSAQSFAAPANSNGDLKPRKTAVSQISGFRSLDGSITEYSIQISMPPNFSDVSFIVHFFYGEFDSSNPSTWQDSPSCLGSKAIFQTNKNLARSASVPLTNRLVNMVQSGQLVGLTEQTVTTYLDGQIRIGIVTVCVAGDFIMSKGERTLILDSKVDGQVLSLAETSAVKILLATEKVWPATSTRELPNYGLVRTVHSLAHYGG